MDRRLFPLALTLVLALAACGGGGHVPGDADALAPVDLPDGTDPGTGGDPEVPDPGCVRCDLPDEEAEAGPAEVTDDAEVLPDCVGCDVGPDALQCPGNFGCPCTAPSECYSAFCTQTPEQSVCSKLCGLGVDCPQGWACERVSPVGGEAIYGCVDPNANLCRPCRTDADCTTLGGGNRRFLCIEQGPEGRFCGSGCEAATDCPEGYECAAVASGRESVKQCRPADGDPCPCTARYRDEGALTECYVLNAQGRCSAERTCDEACAAAIPGAEACNGADDDCDGSTDNGLDGQACLLANPHGTCPGTTRCVGGQSLCEGTAPAAEVCGNGLDEDCDGDTDGEGAGGCGTFHRDDDRDRFGAAGDTKCLCAAAAPYDATNGDDCDDTRDTVKPLATERCNGRDDDCDGLTDEETLAECFPAVCDTPLGACATSCDGPGDCQDPYACDAGLCRRLPGQPCDADALCAGGHCADGTCCLTACDGLCERCDLPLSRGTCTALAAGTDPDDECAPTAAASCGLTGSCSGVSACALWAPGTVCAPSACDSATAAHAASTCDGLGLCEDNGTADCTPFACEAATGLCRQACVFDRDCGAGFACAEGVCLRDEGQGCTTDGECASSFCTDGFCCATRCDGTCEACDVDGARGACTAVAEGADPDDECEASGVDTCGLTGQCSGLRFCSLWAAGSACTSPTCEGAGSSRAASSCDGTGACNAGDLLDCFPYNCDGATGLCRGACTGDEHCQPLHACAGGACRRVEGQECAAAADCASGACVDGLCCDTPCDGLCEACDLPDSRGACTRVAGGQDPDLECPDLEVASCGTVGTCSGVGTCTLHPVGSVCTPRTCASLYASYPADTCDGDGLCQDGGLVQCFPYLCEPVTGACRSACGTSADCQSGYTCATGTCLKSDGEECVGDGECAKGFCTDNVCCEARCGGTCESCVMSGRSGRCDPVPSGEDPDVECEEAGPLSCGTTGSCSGARACALATGGSVCDPARCVDAATAAPADTCDGAGACVDRGTVPCGAFGCDALTGACRTTCTVDGDCQPGNVCAGTTCKKDEGQSCAADVDCASGFCTDRTCCGARCDGPCESCNQPLRAGFCDPVPADSDPDGECPLDAVSSCGRNGWCSGARTCALHAEGTGCLQAVCVNTVTSDPADACDGNGLCMDTATVDCQPYVCDGATGACRTDCTGAGDCASGYACAGTVCKRAPGQNCAVDADCASGFCTDGVCCRARCDGLCEACDQPGRAGYCDAVPQLTDPEEECAEEPASTCGQTGQCSGARTCSLQIGGTACSTSLCAGTGTSILPDVCDGSGTCIDAGTVPCAPYTCDAATGLCRGTCSTGGDCAAGYECSTGTCKKGRGQSCFADGECASGFCTDGYCCTGRCGGTCESCRAAGREGYCDALSAATDPDDECPLDGAASCDRTGWCSGSRTCALYESGTVCAAATCNGDTSSFADTCDGTGNCGDSGTQACVPYTCDPATGLCRATCTVNGDCQAGYSCVGATCRKDAGQPCTTGGECSTGACCDNVCRDLSDDEDHCGQCGTVCQQVNGTNTCRSGVCTPACNTGFDSCDANPDNGCEQALDTLVHCGACARPCARDNAAESCATRTCVLGACDSGWANCDGNDANGCELDLRTDSNSSGDAEYMGEVRGDTGSDTTSVSGRRSRWFRLRVSEGDSGILPQGLSATVNLVSPGGMDYDLWVFAACSGTVLGMSTAATSLDSVQVGWKEHWASGICIGGCEDGQDLWVYVEWFEGSGCGSYTLSATGNTHSDDNVQCQCDSCPFD